MGIDELTNTTELNIGTSKMLFLKTYTLKTRLKTTKCVCANILFLQFQVSGAVYFYYGIGNRYLKYNMCSACVP